MPCGIPYTFHKWLAVPSSFHACCFISSKLFSMLQSYNANNRRQPCITVGQLGLIGTHWLIAPQSRSNREN
jgi:hypothetical protein